MVAVAVRENDRRDRVRRYLCDILQEFLPTRGARLGVDNDHALVTNDHAAVAATALNPVNVGFQLMNHEWRGRLLSPARSRSLRHGQRTQTRHRESCYKTF